MPDKVLESFGIWTFTPDEFNKLDAAKTSSFGKLKGEAPGGPSHEACIKTGQVDEARWLV